MPSGSWVPIISSVIKKKFGAMVRASSYKSQQIKYIESSFEIHSNSRNYIVHYRQLCKRSHHDHLKLLQSVFHGCLLHVLHSTYSICSSQTMKYSLVSESVHLVFQPCLPYSHFLLSFFFNLVKKHKTYLKVPTFGNAIHSKIRK